MGTGIIYEITLSIALLLLILYTKLLHHKIDQLEDNATWQNRIIGMMVKDIIALREEHKK